MKNNIMASEHLMGGKVIKLVSSLTNWIAKKNTMFGSSSEFMGDVHINSQRLEDGNKKEACHKFIQKEFGEKGVVWAND
jgi:hypothetical protein